MARVHILIAFSLLMSSAAPARAASRDEKERAAKKACLNGDPVKGVELLTDLYVDSNNPVYLFNQGRCFEQNNLNEEAIVRFREYLRKTPNASAGDRADAEKHIADCEALLAKQRAETIPPASPRVVGIAQPTPAVVVQPQVRPSAGRGMRVAGIATMATGGAALIAGFALNLKHNSMLADLKDDYSGDTADSAQTYKTLSQVGYGAGAACLVGGAALYWLGYRRGNTVVAPTAVAGSAGILVAGGF